MRKFRSIGCLLMAGVLGASLGFTACGGEEFLDADGNKVTDPSKIVEIQLWNSGLGKEWLEVLTKKYMEDNKGVAMSIVDTASQDTFHNTIEGGAKANSFDLYFTYGPDWRTYFEGTYTGTNYLEDLSSVFNTKIEGESTTIGNKFPQSLQAEMKLGDKWYTGFWQMSANGLLYNVDQFNSHENWKMDTATGLPNTSDQLNQFALRITETKNGDENMTPFLHVKGYSQYLWQVWWAQYEGVDKYQAFWENEFYDYFEAMHTSNSWNTQGEFVQPGVKKALTAFYNIIAPEGRTLYGSNSNDFSVTQSNFLNGKAVMMCNGGWLETEIAKSDSEVQVKDRNIEFMKMPVLSAIVEKLENTEMSDEELSAIIDYIDAGEQGECSVSVSANDLARIRQARNLAYSSGTEINLFIPSYAEGKEVAKDFLKFMYSDAGTALYIQTTKQIPPWYVGNVDSLDTTGWSSFAKSQIAIQSNSTYIFKSFQHPMLYNAFKIEAFYDAPEAKFTAAYENDRRTVATFIAEEIGKLQNNWGSIRNATGLAE